MKKMDEENNWCKTKITENGLEMEGKCAQGLLEAFEHAFHVSKIYRSEIFACACVDPETRNVEKAVIGNIGTPTSVSTEGIERVCSKGTLQISYHTHPTSGKAKLSVADGAVMVDRFNKRYDDAHCVAGDNEHMCIAPMRLKNRRLSF